MTQIASLKESFALLDHDNDGLISRGDLTAMLTSLGHGADSASLDQYFPDDNDKMTLAKYVTMMQKLIQDVAPAKDLNAALDLFKTGDEAKIPTEALEAELNRAAIDPKVLKEIMAEFTKTSFKSDEFDYTKFVKTLCGPEKET